MSDKKTEAPAAPAGGPAGPAAGESGGGLKAWLPLIVTIVLMPVLAFVTTKFVIVPKVISVQAQTGDHAEGEEPAADDHGAAKEEHGKPKAEHGAKKEEHGAKKEDHGKPAKGGGHGEAKAGKKQNAQLAKVIVNVSGTMGTRYLMSSFTLVGERGDFTSLIEENKDQLLDLATSSLASKTISDLEKPGARNQIRSELLAIFNNALGSAVVKEIFFTEFAIQ